MTTLSVSLAACHISYLSAWSLSICWTNIKRSLFSSSRSSLLRSNCATPIFVLMSLSSSSSSSAPSSPTALCAPLPAPLLPLATVPARPPTRLGVLSFSAASRAFSALLFLPRFFLTGAAVTDTAEPDIMLALSLSKPTLGERAPNGASSGGKEVCRSGWAEPVEAMDMVECFLRFRAGDGPESAVPRLLFELFPFVRVLRGSWLCDGYGGECAGGEVWLWYGGELIVIEIVIVTVTVIVSTRSAMLEMGNSESCNGFLYSGAFWLFFGLQQWCVSLAPVGITRSPQTIRVIIVANGLCQCWLLI